MHLLFNVSKDLVYLKNDCIVLFTICRWDRNVGRVWRQLGGVLVRRVRRRDGRALRVRRGRGARQPRRARAPRPAGRPAARARPAAGAPAPDHTVPEGDTSLCLC